MSQVSDAYIAAILVLPVMVRETRQYAKDMQRIDGTLRITTWQPKKDVGI